MTSICIIPARGGSQRIPKKNIRTFHGQPIIAYSIQTAIASKLFDRIVVSTDDFELAAVAELEGAEFLQRPAHLCRDTVGTQQVMEWVLFTQLAPAWYDTACCLYATAPMLTPETLRRAAGLLQGATPYVVPVGEWLKDPGQFYFGNSNAFTLRAPLNVSETKICYVDPATCCDINTEEDWQRALRMYAGLHPVKDPK